MFSHYLNDLLQVTVSASSSKTTLTLMLKSTIVRCYVQRLDLWFTWRSQLGPETTVTMVCFSLIMTWGKPEFGFRTVDYFRAEVNTFLFSLWLEEKQGVLTDGTGNWLLFALEPSQDSPSPFKNSFLPSPTSSPCGMNTLGRNGIRDMWTLLCLICAVGKHHLRRTSLVA